MIFGLEIVVYIVCVLEAKKSYLSSYLPRGRYQDKEGILSLDLLEGEQGGKKSCSVLTNPSPVFIGAINH